MAGAGRQLRVRRGGPADAVLLRTHLGLYAAREGAGQSASLVQAARAVSSRGEGRRWPELVGAVSSSRASQSQRHSANVVTGIHARLEGLKQLAGNCPVSTFRAVLDRRPWNRNFDGTVDAPPKRDSRS